VPTSAARGIGERLVKLLEIDAVPCAPRLMAQLGAAVERAGLPHVDLPSGAGHDAMRMAELTDVAMLFVRCGNGGISHNPHETMTADDADIAGRVLLDFLEHFNETQG
jgi:N-carbamoyl-L-amino-acid hydrolase